MLPTRVVILDWKRRVRVVSVVHLLAVVLCVANYIFDLEVDGELVRELILLFLASENDSVFCEANVPHHLEARGTAC